MFSSHRLLLSSDEESLGSVLHGDAGVTPEHCGGVLAAMGVPESSSGAAVEEEGEGEGMRSLREQIPIAERFRFAYILRRERVTREYNKEKKRRWRKEAKKMGERGSQNLVNRWLDDPV